MKKVGTAPLFTAPCFVTFNTNSYVTDAMQRFRHILRLLVLSLGLSILGVNLVMASVPRCTILHSLFAGAEEHAIGTDHGTDSCHEDPVADAGQGPAIKDGRFCQCSLLSCLVFFIPDYVPNSYIVFLPATERLLVYPLTENRSNFIADIEAPPPRA